ARPESGLAGIEIQSAAVDGGSAGWLKAAVCGRATRENFSFAARPKCHRDQNFPGYFGPQTLRGKRRGFALHGLSSAVQDQWHVFYLLFPAGSQAHGAERDSHFEERSEPGGSGDG